MNGRIFPKGHMLGRSGDLSVDVDDVLRDNQTMSLFGQQAGTMRSAGHGGRSSATRRLPTPYPWQKFKWREGANIARLPSVSGGNITSGNERPLSPQLSIDGAREGKKGFEDFRRRYRPQNNNEQPTGSGIMEILIGPSRRWRENALRNLPYLGQAVKTVRGNILRALRG